MTKTQPESAAIWLEKMAWHWSQQSWWGWQEPTRGEWWQEPTREGLWSDSSGGVHPAGAGWPAGGGWATGGRDSSGGLPPAAGSGSSGSGDVWAGAHNLPAVHRRLEGLTKGVTKEDIETVSGPSRDHPGWMICIRSLGWQSKQMFDFVFKASVLDRLTEAVMQMTSGVEVQMNIRGRSARAGERYRPGRHDRNELIIFARTKDAIDAANLAWSIMREEAVNSEWGVGDEQVTMEGVVARAVGGGLPPDSSADSGGVPPDGLPEAPASDGSGGVPPAVGLNLTGAALTF